MLFSPLSPVGYCELIIRHRVGRARAAQDRGASAIEWVVISAFLILIAATVGGILMTKIQGAANNINPAVPAGGGAGGGAPKVP